MTPLRRCFASEFCVGRRIHDLQVPCALSRHRFLIVNFGRAELYPYFVCICADAVTDCVTASRVVVGRADTGVEGGVLGGIPRNSKDIFVGALAVYVNQQRPQWERHALKHT